MTSEGNGRVRHPRLEPLRRAAGAAVVMPAVFACAATVLHSRPAALFAAFGSFAMLVMVDFTGPPRTRLAAYLTLGCAGAALVVLGSLCGVATWSAVAGMAVVGFVILLAGALNGYLAAAATAALLAFVLPVTISAPLSAIPARLAGWALAAVASVCSVLLLWPPRPRASPRADAARACRAVAGLLESTSDGDRSVDAARARAAHAAVDELRRRLRAVPHRPTGPAGPAAALAALPDELDWLLSFLIPPAGDPLPEPRGDGPTEAVAATVAVLRASAGALDGGPARPELDRLDRARDASMRALAGQIPDPSAGLDGDGLLAALTPAFRVVAISFAARLVAGYALLASGAAERSAARPGSGLRPRSLSAAGRAAAVRAGTRSVWFRNSVRGAVGLAAAVLVARWSGAQHSFWIVLGTLSVLRSNALCTGSSVLRALAGTGAGIVLGAVLVVGTGSHQNVLWGVFPVAVLFAGYASRAISFAAGQAAFTVVILLLFDLIQPTGWTVGLVRIEDVAIGFGVSLGVGILFWPRGASTVLHQNLAEAYVRCADHVLAAVRELVGAGDRARTERTERTAAAAVDRLNDAFAQYLAERSPKGASLEPVAALVGGTTRMWRIARSLSALDRMAGTAARPGRCAAELDGEARVLHSWYAALGDSLARTGSVPPPHERDPRRPGCLLACARDAVAVGDGIGLGPALALLWAGQHLDSLWRLESHLGRRDRR